jgi:hypothetical protein
MQAAHDDGRSAPPWNLLVNAAKDQRSVDKKFSETAFRSARLADDLGGLRVNESGQVRHELSLYFAPGAKPFLMPLRKIPIVLRSDFIDSHPRPVLVELSNHHGIMAKAISIFVYGDFAVAIDGILARNPKRVRNLMVDGQARNRPDL